ncbi:MAG TPA: AI-2E family transporter [Ktedonobacteraceae bacterium]
MMFSMPSEGPEPSKGVVPAAWVKRLVISLTLLVWVVLVIVVARVLGYVSTALLILVIAGLIAYAVLPLVEFFQRVMPRALAVLLVYLVILGVLALLFYFLVVTSLAQIESLAAATSSYFRSGKPGQLSPIMQILRRVGVSQAQIQALSGTIGEQLAGIATDVAKNVFPLISGVAGGVINVLLTAVISIYLVVDGGRVITWVRDNVPLAVRRGTIGFVEILQRVVGGYVRGQVVLCALMGFLVGLGMFILGVPYAILLGTLGGFLEFIPVIGTITSGVICCLIALTQGWLTFFLALIYFIVLHIFEGYILAPRIVGKAIGLHPAVSLLALAAGGDLFGPMGAILAAPVAGLIQSVLIALWLYYRSRHKEQFAGSEQGKKLP